jgi:hypothetical protein
MHRRPTLGRHLGQEIYLGRGNVTAYFAPGMFKTIFTVRTGNAWVHVWAYHAVAPHTLVDTPHMVHVFHLR